MNDKGVIKKAVGADFPPFMHTREVGLVSNWQKAAGTRINFRGDLGKACAETKTRHANGRSLWLTSH